MTKPPLSSNLIVARNLYSRNHDYIIETFYDPDYDQPESPCFTGCWDFLRSGILPPSNKGQLSKMSNYSQLNVDPIPSTW